MFTVTGQDAPERFVHTERAVAADTTRFEHWIDVYLDEHLPGVDPQILLSVTSDADVYCRSTGQPAPSFEIAATHAFQADVWDAINHMEDETDG